MARVAVDEIVGRERELDAIARMLDGGGALLLEGNAGIGKTTLWQRGVELARGRRFEVLTAAPAEAERSFSYAALGDLTRSVPEGLVTGLPPPQRRALERALLRSDGEGELDVRAVAVGVYSVLAAFEGPVVVAIDDVQWLDAASAAALDFALRRMPSLRILLAVRAGTSSPLRVPAEIIQVGPLSVGAVHHLLVERLGIALPRPALRRLHEASGGNPFYALELGRANPGGGLVLPPSLQEVVADRVRALPARTRRDLAELALAGRVARGADLTPAVAARVVEVHGEAARFVHPLLAEAAVGLLDPDERRLLHRDIAVREPDAERRARHLAMAAAEPDRQVAALVAGAAGDATTRTAAAELWELAADLTPEDEAEQVAERRVEAGIAHMLAGNPDHGASLLEANLDLLPRGSLRQRGLAHLALMLGREDVGRTIDPIEVALSEADDPWMRLELVNMLCSVLSAAEEMPRAAALADGQLAEVEPSGDDELTAAALSASAVYRICSDRPAWEMVERIRALAPARMRGADAFALIRDGRIDEARALYEEQLADSEALPIYGYHGLVANLSIVEIIAGRWAAAERYADEALMLGEQIEAPIMVSDGLTISALVDALLGRVEDAREKVGRAHELAERVRSTQRANYALYTLGLLELSLGSTEAAANAYRAVTDSGWTRWVCWAGARPAADAVEALCEVGDVEQAQTIAATLVPDARERPLTAACLASASGDHEQAIELLRSASPAPVPFGEAREQLLLGRFLRRARRRGDARAALTLARGGFDRLGAVLWVERADEELSRLGGRSPSGATLTASERRVAELVAAGLSNKEVAAQLVITVRTVEAHLSKIYAKLGVRSRSGLAAVWKEQAPE